MEIQVFLILDSGESFEKIPWQKKEESESGLGERKFKIIIFFSGLHQLP
jgi:hypothetical protein